MIGTSLELVSSLELVFEWSKLEGGAEVSRGG